MKNETETVGIGTSDLLDVLGLAYKLRDIHKTITGFMGDKWPERASEIKTLIRAIAVKEGKEELAVAVQRAKACDSAMCSLQILAAAYELSSANAVGQGRPAPDSHSNTHGNSAGRSL